MLGLFHSNIEGVKYTEQFKRSMRRYGLMYLGISLLSSASIGFYLAFYNFLSLLPFFILALLSGVMGINRLEVYK